MTARHIQILQMTEICACTWKLI